MSTLSLTAALAHSPTHRLDLNRPALDHATCMEVAVGRWGTDAPQYVRLLLRHGAQPHLASLFTAAPPVFVAARAGKVGALAALLDHGGDVFCINSSDGRCALHAAAASDHEEVGIARINLLFGSG